MQPNFARALFRSFVFLGAAAQIAGAQAPAAKPHPASALGYEDTPVLPGQPWRVHHIQRPHPPIVTPGTGSTPDRPGRPPSDAVVLFDGKDLSQWVGRTKGKDPGKAVAPEWKLGNGYMEIVGRTGDLYSREKFGDIQLHVEWAVPAKVDASDPWRGNSGVILMGFYEIQVHDSYNNPVYADGQAGAIYGQWPPLVDPSRKPGEWQIFDIVFEAPRFGGEKLEKSGYVTLFYNGVLVHYRRPIIGRMAHRAVAVYTPHGAEEPLVLQDHGVPVRYRNIWVRRLKGYDQP